MKILAGIVSFNPDIQRLKENLDAICMQVDEIVVIENGSRNGQSAAELVNTYGNALIIRNTKNEGIAAALGQIMEYAIRNFFDWVLTLDQDSVCRAGLIEQYLKYTSLDHIGILTCNIIDRNFKQSSGLQEGQAYRDVRQCITSAAFTNVEAYKKTDGYDQKLFIDSVDFDLCINMRKHGFRIVKIAFDGILHEVGHGKNVKLFSKDYVTYNHAPFRQYYMARNHRYLVQKYPEEFSKSREVAREIRTEVLILLYESSKFAKLKARHKGLRDAGKMR